MSSRTKPISERFTRDPLNGVNLHAMHWGQPGKPLVILLHGGGANVHWWDHIAPELAEHRHIVALDFRGHGDSDYPENYVTGAFNQDLEALCHHLGQDKMTFIAHSMGAQVVLDHASRFDVTQGIMLIDPARGTQKRTRRAARLALSLARTYATKEEAMDRFQFVPIAEHVAEPLRRHIASHSVRLQENERWGFKFDGHWFGVPPRPKPDLKRVQCPCLVIRGAESELLSSEGASELCEELPHGRTLEIMGSGHHVLLDRPDELIVAAQSFLSEISPREKFVNS